MSSNDAGNKRLITLKTFLKNEQIPVTRHTTVHDLLVTQFGERKRFENHSVFHDVQLLAHDSKVFDLDKLLVLVPIAPQPHEVHFWPRCPLSSIHLWKNHKQTEVKKKPDDPILLRRRLQHDVDTCKKDGPQFGIYVDFWGGTPGHYIQAAIAGPAGTPYEGGMFNLLIEAPVKYPLRPARLTVITPILHPNIVATRLYEGAMSETLELNYFTPAIDLFSWLMVIRSRLANPSYRRGCSSTWAIAAEHGLQEEFKREARNWTKQYASNCMPPGLAYWTPQVHHKCLIGVQNMAMCMFMLQRRRACVLHKLPKPFLSVILAYASPGSLWLWQTNKRRQTWPKPRDLVSDRVVMRKRKRDEDAQLDLEEKKKKRKSSTIASSSNSM